MIPTVLAKPKISSVGDYISKSFGSDKSDPPEAGRSFEVDSLLHDSNLEKAIQATNHLLDQGVDGNEDLLKQIEEFGLDITDELKSDSAALVSALTGFQSQMKQLKSTTEAYVNQTLLPSNNVSQTDKDDILTTFIESESFKEFSEFKSETKIFKNDSDFLLKTLSAIRNGLEGAEEDLDPDIFSGLTKAIDQQTKDFFETGEVNNSVIQDILDKTTALKDSADRRLVKIDNENEVKESIKQRVATKVNQSARDRVRNTVQTTLKAKGLGGSEIESSFVSGEVSTNALLDHLKTKGLLSDKDISSLSSAIDEALSRDSSVKDVLSSVEEELSGAFELLSKDAKLQIDQQKAAHLEGRIDAASLRQTMEDRLTSVSDLSREQLGHLGLMETRLSHIDENTEGDKLSSADKIRNSNRREEEEDTSDKLASVLDGIKTRDNATVAAGLFSGVSSAEDIGESATDALFDSFGDSDEGDRKRRKRRRGGRSRRGRRGRGGKLGKLLKGGKGLLGAGAGLLGKGGGLTKGLSSVAKVGGALTVAKGAFDLFTAESTEERKGAAGSTVGGIVGGALGSLLGPLGTVAGAYVGAELGTWIAGLDWFTSPQDAIPDDVKKAGPAAEMDYIGSVLLPEIQRSLATKSGQYDEDDVTEIKEYAEKLQGKIKKQTTSSPLAKEISDLESQGATPEMISLVTNTPVETVNDLLTTKPSQVIKKEPLQRVETNARSIDFKPKAKEGEGQQGGTTTIQKSEDNSTTIIQSSHSRRDSMRDLVRSAV